MYYVSCVKITNAPTEIIIDSSLAFDISGVIVFRYIPKENRVAILHMYFKNDHIYRSIHADSKISWVSLIHSIFLRHWNQFSHTDKYVSMSQEG